MAKKSPRNSLAQSRGTYTARGQTRSVGDATETTSNGRGRHLVVTEYEVDPPDIHDRLRGTLSTSRPPVRVKYYKLTRTQHYASLGPLYGVTRKPGQSLRGYAREVERVVTAALARNQKPENK